MSSMPLFEQPRAVPKRRKLAEDKWGRKLTIPEWNHLVIERPRGAFIAGTIIGVLTIAVLQQADAWVGVLFYLLLYGAHELKNRRDSKH